MNETVASPTANTTIPGVTLRDGVTIPQLGYGCAFGDWIGRTRFQGFLPEQAWHSIHLALEAGFRHFDTAYCYGTERHLGDLLGRRFADGSLVWRCSTSNWRPTAWPDWTPSGKAGPAVPARIHRRYGSASGQDDGIFRVSAS